MTRGCGELMMMMELRAVREEAVREVERKGKLWRNLLA